MFKKLIFLGLIFSCQANANIILANQALEQADFVTAEQQLKKLAFIGNPEAQFKLALLNYQGKAGQVNKSAAFAWFFMAAEYGVENADQLATEIFSELTSKEQLKAKSLAKEYREKYGKLTLLKSVFPLLLDEKIEEQIIDKEAKVLVDFKLREDDIALIDKEARARKLRANQTAELIAKLNKGYRHNAYDNFDKFELEDASGLVIVQHDLDENGDATDSEVLFSWPIGKFNEVITASILKNKYSPALKKELPVQQYNLVAQRRVGKHGKNSFRSEYPQGYKYFLKMKKKAQDDINAKYIYASMLRAYADIIGAKQEKTYQQLLLELANSGYILAQYDYAQYLIYEENNIDQGLYWLTQAVKAGYTDAEYRLGDILYQSPSAYLKQDLHKAKFWLKRAADKGHTKALAKLKLIESH